MAKTRIHRTPRGTIAFRIIFAVSTVLLIVIILALLSVLWNFLEVYEISQPENAIKEFVQKLETDKSIMMDNANVTLNAFEGDDAIENYLENITDGNISYIRDGKNSNQEQTAYILKINNEKIADVTVIPDQEESLGFGKYKYIVSDFYMPEIPTHNYSVIAPNNAELYCNGIKVEERYITQNESEYEEIKNFHGLIEDPPINVVYEIQGFINAPEFTAKDENGVNLELADGAFSLAQQKDEALSELALKFSQTYSKYIMNDGRLAEVAGYLAPDMPIYAELQGYENFWHNWHTNYDFLDIKLGDPIFYTPDNAAVKVEYDHVLYGVQSADNGELHTEADYTIYLVNIEGEWKVTELVLN